MRIMRTIYRYRWAGLVLSALACSDPSSPLSLAGTYALTTVDGSALPFSAAVADAPGWTETTTNGEVGLRADGTWYLSVNSHVNFPSGQTQAVEDGDEGTFTTEGNAITFTCTRIDKGRVFTGDVSGDGAVTVPWKSRTYRYQRIR
jgi:hypothetical protein